MIGVRRLSDLAPGERAGMCRRVGVDDTAIQTAVQRILAAVRAEGDAALLRLTRELDGVEIPSVEVGADDRARGAARAYGVAREALAALKARIEEFHRHTRREGFEIQPSKGVRLGERIVPYDRAGIYVPGGLASYPSTALMAAVPARIAGVREIVLCSPPLPDGTLSPNILVAAELCGVARVFRVGGAQAIAAMAFGTATVPKVDIVVGPGNAYVTAAKALVRDEVAIDLLAGPTELVVVSDGTPPPEAVAEELLAQAEHGPSSVVILVATDEAHAHAVAGCLERQVSGARREKILREALAAQGRILVADRIDDAIAFANEFAPEHLLLALATPGPWLEAVTAAGAVSLGIRSSVALADYGTGPNHILPTGGAARRMSALSAATFQRTIPYQELSADAAADLARHSATVARLEGLHEHARAVARAQL